MSKPPDDGQIPWWERHPRVFEAELAAIRKFGFRPRLARFQGDADERDPPERLIARGKVRVKAARPDDVERWHGLLVDIAYPIHYPFDPLDIIPLDPAIRRRRHQLRKSGELCYMQEELEPWALGYGIERAIQGAEDWWRGEITGTFEAEVPAAELLFYLEPSSRLRAILIPDHAEWRETLPPFGALKLEWDRREGGLALVALCGKNGRDIPKPAQEANQALWKSMGRSLDGIRPFERVPGIWLALDSEPIPFSNLQELEEQLLRCAGVSSGQFRALVARAIADPRDRGRGWVPIGLNYPARIQGTTGDNTREWFFAALEWGRLPKSLAKCRQIRRSFWGHVRTTGMPSHPIARPSLIRRVGDLYPVDALRDRHVMVVGTGALGSTVARRLAASGVGRLTLVDDDAVQPGNLVRHEARMPDVGELKVRALERIVYETNPYTEVETILGTRSKTREVEACIRSPRRKPDLIVATVALKAVDGQVADLVRRLPEPMPVLHAWVLAQAQVLRCFVYWVGKTACFWCNSLYYGDAKSGQDNGYVIDPSVEAQPFFETSCSSPAFPGSGNANGLAAHVITEMALDVLHKRLPEGESHWVFAGNRVHELDPDYPVGPLTIDRRGFTPHPQCPVCSDRWLDGASSEYRDVLREEVDRLRDPA